MNPTGTDSESAIDLDVDPDSRRPNTPAGAGRGDPSLRLELGLALRSLPPTWPLRTFVAANPLAGFEDRALPDALAEAAEPTGAYGVLAEREYLDLFAAGMIDEDALRRAVHAAVRAPGVEPPGPHDLVIDGTHLSWVDLIVADLLARPPLAVATAPRRQVSSTERAIDEAMSRWAAAYLDPHATWPMPHRARGFWAAWCRLVVHDPTVRALVGDTGLAAIAQLPAAPDDALHALLGRVEGARGDVLRGQLQHLPGWSMAMARGAREGVDLGAPADLVGFVAARLALAVATAERDGRAPTAAVSPEPDADAPQAVASQGDRARLVLHHVGIATPDGATQEAVARLLALVPSQRRAHVWQEALEATAHERLLARLATSPAPPIRSARSDAHLVCCIDPRSEGLRRHLEARGNYTTIGFAGFFGLPVRIQRDGAPTAEPSCPVLVDPRAIVVETDRFDPHWSRRQAREAVANNTLDAVHDAKVAPMSAFALAEAGGWISGVALATRTFRPTAWRRARRRVDRHLAAGITTRMDLDGSAGLGGIGLEDQVLLAESILRTMGLTEGFAPLVVLCGHGSHHTNNPFRAANDCGACGGRRGGVNARVAADVLNRFAVREALSAAGISIPADTWFVAAEHDTASDRVHVFDVDRVPLTHRAGLAALQADLAHAGAALAAERCGELPGAPAALTPVEAAAHVRERAADWAQVVPEWGLMGNHALVIAPRWVTRPHDLGRRVFLHDYEAAQDPDGRVLTTILTGPMVVAHWICSQYRFSTTDPEVFGAGAKPLHNVVAGLGVLEGAGGDLRLGLPLESVRWQGRPVHLPGRLLVVIQAPPERVDRILRENPVLHRLVGGGWVRLVTRSGPDAEWHDHRVSTTEEEH